MVIFHRILLFLYTASYKYFNLTWTEYFTFFKKSLFLYFSLPIVTDLLPKYSYTHSGQSHSITLMHFFWFFISLSKWSYTFSIFSVLSFSFHLAHPYNKFAFISSVLQTLHFHQFFLIPCSSVWPAVKDFNL